MATFISTLKFTDQGIKAVGETGKRSAAFKALAEKMGVTVKDIYWTLGDYDSVVVSEAPDDETITALMLHLASFGNVRPTTTRAFNAQEMDALMAKAGGG